MDADPNADLVLVGGGHAHVQVLRRWMMAPMAGVRLTVVLDRPTAMYSGMVPGYVAGDYDAAELTIDGVPLARRAGARVVLAPAVSIDPAAHRIDLSDRPPLHYDVASLDVGATVRGLDLPGVREHALATRPIGRFVEEAHARLERACRGRSAEERPRVAVVGGGAAGLELALTLEARLRAAGRPAAVTLLTEGEDVLEGRAPRVRRVARHRAEARGIRVRTGARVRAVRRDAVELEDGRLPADLVVWATGAAPLPFPCGPGLPLDDAGFVRVGPTLAVEGTDDLFAVGDCASPGHAPWVGKAGVYAVRAGPVLDANLRARLRGRPRRDFRPQRDFLMLLNAGGREALGARWGFALEGPWVWRLKDWIDRRFVRRFQVLDADGAPRPGFPAPAPAAGEATGDGACALAPALARLPKPPPDPRVRAGPAEAASAALLTDARGGVTVTALGATGGFTDDPWWVGRVAAVNAVSEVLAAGGRARSALALVNLPESRPELAEETLFQVLSGARAALDPLGVSLAGGRATRAGALSVGLSATGELGDEPFPRAGLAPGDRLVLTRPLGGGVLLAADRRGLLPGPALGPLLEGLARPDVCAARVAREFDTRGCTVVSGLGVVGHLVPLLRASGVSARLFAGALPVWPGAADLLARDVRSGRRRSDARGRRGIVVERGAVGAAAELLFDAQISGGLLFGVGAARAAEAVRALRAGGDAEAAVIGVVRPPRFDRARIEVVSRSEDVGEPTSSP